MDDEFDESKVVERKLVLRGFDISNDFETLHLDKSQDGYGL